MEKMMNTKTEGNTFTKKIGQKVYGVRYHFNAGENQPNAGYRSKPNGNVLKLVGCN